MLKIDTNLLIDKLIFDLLQSSVSGARCPVLAQIKVPLGHIGLLIINAFDLVVFDEVELVALFREHFNEFLKMTLIEHTELWPQCDNLIEQDQQQRLGHGFRLGQIKQSRSISEFLLFGHFFLVLVRKFLSELFLEVRSLEVLVLLDFRRQFS